MMNNISNEYLNSYRNYDRYEPKGNKPPQKGDKATGYKDGDIVQLDISKSGMEALREAKQDETENIGDKESKKASFESTEYKLSDKAKDFLQSLREKYGDYDFFVADTSEDMYGLLNSSKRDIAVAFSSAELEKMANDDEYAQKKLSEMESLIDKAKEIAEEVSESDEGVNVKSITISMNDDGSYNLFAELEKASEKQRERIEKSREDRAEERKEKENRAEEKKEREKKELHREDGFKKDMLRIPPDVKKTTVSASSAEELKELISGVNWDEI